jgi:hypothetical protein
MDRLQAGVAALSTPLQRVTFNIRKIMPHALSVPHEP